MARVAAKPVRLAFCATYWRMTTTALTVAAGVALGGCQSQPQAPIVQKSATQSTSQAAAATPAKSAIPVQAGVPDVHIVARGDTLHGIAWRYGLDFRELVRWNRLANPDLIYVGQRMRLAAPGAAPVVQAPAAAPAAPTPRPAPVAAARAPAAPAAPAVTTPAITAPPPPKRAPDARPVAGWQWPAEGKVTHARSVSGTRGIEIRGQRGQDVRAAAGGKVVYSGSGLRGYGELIIVKHDETYLSAYAHNEIRLVEEGQAVKGGQVIARMGDTEARDVMLHFEIRRNGKSTDPYQYLPKR